MQLVYGEMSDEPFFEVLTPLGFRVRTSRLYWETIVTTKHPVMNERQDAVVEVLKVPDKIRNYLKSPISSC